MNSKDTMQRMKFKTGICLVIILHSLLSLYCVIRDNGIIFCVIVSVIFIDMNNFMVELGDSLYKLIMGCLCKQTWQIHVIVNLIHWCRLVLSTSLDTDRIIGIKIVELVCVIYWWPSSDLHTLRYHMYWWSWYRWYHFIRKQQGQALTLWMHCIGSCARMYCDSIYGNLYMEITVRRQGLCDSIFSGLDDTFIIYEQVVFYCKLSMGIVAPYHGLFLGVLQVLQQTTSSSSDTKQCLLDVLSKSIYITAMTLSSGFLFQEWIALIISILLNFIFTQFTVNNLK